MQITIVTIKKIEKENSRLKGYCSLVIDNSIAINDIKIITGDKGLFVAMPSRKTATGGSRDIAHPINSETRKLFEDAIFEEYNKEVVISNE